jgi:hypothetical protein
MGFWAWVAIPILLIVGLSVSVRAYCRHVERTLAQSEELVQVIPQLEANLAAAREIAQKLTVPAADADGASERLRERIARTAQQCGFVVNSLSIAVTGADQAGPALAVTINGDGTLAALIRFLDGLQSAEALMTVDTASVQKGRLVTQPLYNGVFTFRYSLVTL